MKLTQEQLDKINIEVDDYYTQDGDIYVCELMCAGNDYGTKTVHYNDILKHVADSKGNVTVTDINDTQETTEIPFADWLSSIESSIEFLDVLSEVINKRENRKPLYKVIDIPTTTDILNAIKDCK